MRPAQPAATRRGLRLARALLGALLLVVLAWLLMRGIDRPKLLAALAHSDLRYLLAAAVLDVTLNLTSYVQRLRVLLHAFPATRRERFFEIVGLAMSSYAAGVLVPGQPGVLLRTVVLHRRHGYQYRDLVTAQVVEKLIEFLSLSGLGWLALLGRPPAILAVPLWILALGAPAGVVALLLVARWVRVGEARGSSGRVPAAILRLGGSLARLDDPKRLLIAFAWSLGSHLCGVLGLFLCVVAFQLPVALPDCFLLFLTVNLALLMPLTPGQFGLVEGALVAVLSVKGIPREPALAFALVYHVVQVVPTAVGGIVALPFLWPRIADAQGSRFSPEVPPAAS